LDDFVTHSERIKTAAVKREEEFVELLSRYRHQLFNYIFCIVHSIPDSEDVFQQATIAMWENFDQFDPGTDFLAWATRITKFRAMNFVRSRRREKLTFSEELIADLAIGKLDSAESQESRLRALAACRQKLSATDQKVLALCYGTCNTVSEAAEVLCRPVRSVYDSLWRIRKALYNCIEKTLAREGHV